MVIKAERKKLSAREVQSILKKLKHKLSDEKIPAQAFWIFGSYAKKTHGLDSDIDVAIIVPSVLTQSLKKKIRSVSLLAKQIHVKLEPHVLSDRDFKNRWLSLPAEIKKSGKPF